MFLNIIIIRVCAHAHLHFLLISSVCHPVSLFSLRSYIFLEFWKILPLFLQIFHLFVFLSFSDGFFTETGTFLLSSSFSLPDVSRSVLWPDFVFFISLSSAAEAIHWVLYFNNYIFILKYCLKKKILLGSSFSLLIPTSLLYLPLYLQWLLLCLLNFRIPFPMV